MTNFEEKLIFCTGIQGILEAYRMCISQVQLSGPTNVAPIINHVARFALAAKNEEQHVSIQTSMNRILFIISVLAISGNFLDQKYNCDFRLVTTHTGL